jgi:hypothetical protein
LSCDPSAKTQARQVAHLCPQSSNLPTSKRALRMGFFQQSRRAERAGVCWAGRLLAMGMATALFSGLCCGLKASPQPREVVVPAPAEAVAVLVVPEGLQIRFTLPSRSLDGSPLGEIGGYRILREGPGGKDVREEVRFSVSEMRQMLGRSVAFLDVPPGQAGRYRYCVIPFDAYGSHPSRRQVAGSCWEGFLSEAGAESAGGRGQLPAR